MELFLGIDPGAKGAACLMRGNDIIKLIDLSKEPEVNLGALSDKQIKHCYIEKVGARAGNGANSMFSFGVNYGRILAWLTINKVPYTEVLPRTWQSKYGIYGANSSKKNGTKLMAFEVCKKVYGSDLFLGVRGGLLDGRCDAVLICHYGITNLN